MSVGPIHQLVKKAKQIREKNPFFPVLTLKYKSFVCCPAFTIEVNPCLRRCLSLLAKLYLQKQVCNL